MHHTLIRAKKENFSLHSYSWAYSFCAVLGPCKQKKYSTLKKGYEGSNRLFKKIHHFRDPTLGTLGTLGELLVGKLRISVRGRGSNSFPPTTFAPVARTRSPILGIF